MERKARIKMISGLLFATTLLSVGVFSETSSVFIGSQEVAAETVDNPIANETSERSLTISKYAVRDNSELGAPGDGTPTNPEKQPMSGIQFKVIRVIPKAGGTSLVDPKKQVEGTDYTVDDTFSETIIVTDYNGNAYLDLGTGKTNDGIYLVEELPDERTGHDLEVTNGKKVGTPAAPFFVYVPQTSRTDKSSLIYDVQVEPKNILEDLVEPNKMVNNSKGGSVKAGQDFEWELESNIPAGLWQIASQTGELDILDADGNVVGKTEMVPGEPIIARADDGTVQPNFSMVDVLDDQLTYKDGSAKMQVKNAEGNWVDLDATDYTVEFVEATNTITTKLTEAGLEKVGTASNGFTAIRTVLTTAVAENWNGALDNTFTINHQIPGQKPRTTTPPEGEEPKYANGGLDIEKTGEDTKEVLSGAEFMIADSEENARNGIFVASDGESYAKDATLPEGVTFLTSTSDAEGLAAFDGLALVWTDANDDKIAQDTEFSRDYWVVETKAPEGYELLKEPQKITVTTTTHEDSTIELNVVDKPTTDLPFTGGEGTTLLIVIALGAITIGTAAVIIEKRRKQA